MGIFDMFSSGNEEDAMNALIAAAQDGNAAAADFLKKGLDASGKFDKKALKELMKGSSKAAKAVRKSLPKYYQQGTRTGYNSYLDALGLHGDAGVARAQDQFQTSPGYQFAVDQAVQGLERRAANRGMLGSGNTSEDSMALVHGIADQEWQQYLDRLSGFQGHAANVAGLKAQKGRDLASIYTGKGRDAAGIYTGMGDDYTSYYDKLAGNTLRMYDQIGGAQADYYKSKDDTSANIIGAITGLLKGGVSLFG